MRGPTVRDELEGEVREYAGEFLVTKVIAILEDFLYMMPGYSRGSRIPGAFPADTNLDSSGVDFLARREYIKILPEHGSELHAVYRFTDRGESLVRRLKRAKVLKTKKR